MLLREGALEAVLRITVKLYANSCISNNVFFSPMPSPQLNDKDS